MAYKQNKSNKERYIDLDMNFEKHPITKDVVRKYDDEAIKRSLKNLIFTNKYDRPFQPYIDSRIRRLLFENITPVTANLIQSNLRDLITRYEPRVTLVDIQVFAFPDQNAFECSIYFRIRNQPEVITLKTSLERLR
tara:strand:+ start:1569 stop:1976 length:408 start_codon:yes stop_codon:yes gene_type:complete